jgi:hypothetical protein
MILDWRQDPALPFARCFDAETGDEVPAVVRYDTATGDLTRCALDAAGLLVPDADGTDVAVIAERRRLRLAWYPLPGETVPEVP